MRIVFFCLAALMAGFMAWSWFEPPCEGGAVVASEAECRAVALFDAAFCAKAWGRTEALARTSGPTFQTQTECSDRYPVCIEKDPQGYGPKPGGWCLVRTGSEIARIEAKYELKRR